MRWLWIDRFVEFESGRRAVAIKNVSLAEEQLDGYLPGFNYMPASLIVEGLAQTGGLLVGEAGGFRERVVLAKIGKAVFHRTVLPGDQLTYTTEIRDISEQGAIVNGTSRVGTELQAEIELFFAHLDERVGSEILFEPEEFLCMLRSFGLYDVAKTADGEPVSPPDHLLEAEHRMFPLQSKLPPSIPPSIPPTDQ